MNISDNITQSIWRQKPEALQMIWNCIGEAYR